MKARISFALGLLLCATMAAQGANPKLSVGNGGTGATTASAARANLRADFETQKSSQLLAWVA